MRIILLVCYALFLIQLAAQAGETQITAVEMEKMGDQSYSFDVTLLHEDEGWDHYADRWEILAPDGTILATRTLHHPHVNEQPFTRSLSGVKIPREIDHITIRAHDSIHGYGRSPLSLPIHR